MRFPEATDGDRAHSWKAVPGLRVPFTVVQECSYCALVVATALGESPPPTVCPGEPPDGWEHGRGEGIVADLPTPGGGEG